MQMYLDAQREEIWDVVENVPFIPITVINNIEQAYVKGFWTNDDKKKVLFDKKAKNILASALGMDELFYVASCETTKEI